MKNHITISLDQEIVEKLKQESNYSDVINEQLKGYYYVKQVDNIETLKQNLYKTKQILKENRKKRREIEAQIKKIYAKQILFKQNLLSKSKMVEVIKRRREMEAQNKSRRITYFETPEAEADRLMKGGSK